MKNKSGFTIVEVLVVVIVISILTSIAVVTYNQYLKDARDDRRLADIKLLAKSMDDYLAKNGNYPVTCTPGTGLANDCINLGTTYPSTTPPTIQPNMTSAQFKAIFPNLNTDFGDPLGDSSASPLNKTTGGALQKRSYYLLSLDLITGSFTQNFASKTGTFTCSFTGTGSNYAASAGTRPKNLVFGYYSDGDNAWRFYFLKPSANHNVLNWNTGSNTLCNATETGL